MPTITMTVPEWSAEDLKDIDDWQLKLLLMDALAEFVSHRANGDGARYVDKRYPEGSGGPYEGERRQKKVSQVVQRCRWANALHGAEIVKIDRSS